jgi:probable nitrogen fixation protein
MTTVTENLAIDAQDPLLQSDFAKQMAKQLRALDTYDLYEKWSDAKVLDPLILTKERKAEIPIIGDPDEETIARVKAYYNALASLIEAHSGVMAVPFINLSHEGFGRALIMTGKLIVVDKTLRDVHRFGFKSLEKMCEEAMKTITKALELLEQHRDVASL